MRLFLCSWMELLAGPVMPGVCRVSATLSNYLKHKHKDIFVVRGNKNSDMQHDRGAELFLNKVMGI